ncbi:MAG: AAC(3) family N-acetyltransferase [Lentisphaeria bacterium]|nr:AAC(3) family N-acetyltransferase [Lentisphaeria bacterium]
MTKMTKKTLAENLRKLGLAKGDKVLLHSSYLSLGGVEGGPEKVIDAFMDVLGKEGTLLVPIFGSLGILTTLLRNRPGAVIDPCPVGTLAALGKDGEKLFKDHWKAETAHGENTPFTRLADMGGYVCLMGVDQDRNTTLHAAEALLRLPYLGEVSAEFSTPAGKKITGNWKYYPGPHRDFIGLDRAFRESGKMKIARIGNSQIRLIKASDLLEIAVSLGKKDPAFVLCDNPACADCVKQRAAIFADKMAKESFTLSASSRLAGRYLPEMAENLHKAGISYIELDFLQGKACALLPEEKLEKAVRELAEEGIKVSALSVESVPDDMEKFLKKVKKAGIKTLILPMNGAKEGETAAKKGFDILFRNTNETSRRFSDSLAAFRGKSEAKACFSPAGFVRAGEHPFLGSYRVGRFIKTLGQLDICDALWDGTATALARGNGEIKEMISILRCHNFAGFFTLGGGAVYPGTLAEAAKNFDSLLENM